MSDGYDDSDAGTTIVNVDKKCRHKEGRFHDCTYVNSIDALIPIAMNFAMRDLSRGYRNEDERFHFHIDRLAHERGIRKTTRSEAAGVVELRLIASNDEPPDDDSGPSDGHDLKN
jgi:hypothetical protein